MLIIRLLSLDNVERIYEPTLIAAVLLTPVQDVTVDEDKRSRLDLAHRILLVRLVLRGAVLRSLQRFRELRALVVDEARSFGPVVLSCSHEAFRHGRALVRTGCEAEAPVLCSRVFQRIPPAYCAWWVGVEERAILVRAHFCADLRLLAYDHGLQTLGVAEAQGSRDGSIARGQGDLAEGRGQLVEVVTNLVDGALLGLRQVAGLVEGLWADIRNRVRTNRL